MDFPFKKCPMLKLSAGILLYRFYEGALQVLLAHPGGPFWAKKDLGSWTIPKGEFTEPELPLEAALRELEEETGIKVSGNLTELTPVKQKGGKTILAWAAAGNAESALLKSNSFSLEWPPRSGKFQSFPEIDKLGWFALPEAEKKINPGQIPLLHELANILQ